jgi:succinate-acetate transporter protein
VNAAPASGSDGGGGHEEQVRIFLRPIGSALPLGFFSFGIGMLLLGTFALGWIPLDEQQQVGLTLAAFVFPLELVATIVAFLARDTLGATTLGLFAASWLTLGLSYRAAAPGETSVAIAVYLFGFAATALVLALMSIPGKPFFTALLAVAVVRMVLSGWYEAGGSKELLRVSGGFGIALAALALYGGAALGLEDARQRELLPLFRRGKADEAFQGYAGQVARLEREPGVRQQL